MKLLLQGLVLRQGSFVLRARAHFRGGSVGIAGPSGAGKTSLLELIAGLRRPSEGRLQWGSQPLDDPAQGLFVPPRLRRVAYVPQDAELFPHLGVRANLRFGEARASAGGPGFDEVVAMLGIHTLLDRDPSTLSGGERRRVALGRALLAGPELLLLDEPFTGLDSRSRKALRDALSAMRRRLKLPLILVSHERSDLGRLCEEVVTMRGGIILRQ